MLPVGSPVIGKDFIDREREINTIIKSLEKNSVLLIAPRKYGKTSIMKKIEEIFIEKGISILFIDVYHMDDPREFLTKIGSKAFGATKNKKSFIEGLKSSFGRLKDIEEFKISPTEFKIKFSRSLKKEFEKNGWKDKGRKLFTDIGSSFDGIVYLIIDEFPEFVLNMSKKNAEEAETFLKWFRSVRIQEHDLRFIMAGSVSIDRIIRTVTTSPVIDDLQRVPVKGFSRKTALHIVEEVFKEEGWKYNEKIGEKIVECMGNPAVPYFLSAFLGLVDEESMGRNLDEKTIAELYKSKLMGVQGKHYFDYYVKRFKCHYTTQEEKAAKAILRILCQTGEIQEGIAFEIFKNVTNGDHEQFIDLIFDLKNDFYIEQIEDKIVFYSKPLADWWRLYYA